MVTMPSQKASAFAPGHITGFFHLPSRPRDFLSRQVPVDLMEMSFHRLRELAGTYRGVGSVGAGFSIDKGMTTEAVVNFEEGRVRVDGTGGRRGAHGVPGIPGSISLSCSFNGKACSLRELENTWFMTTALLKCHHENGQERPPIGGITLTITTPLPLKAGFGLSGAAALSTAFALSAALSLSLSQEEIASLAHFADCYFRGGLGDVSGQLLGGFEHRRQAGLPGTGEIVSLPFPDSPRDVLFLVSEARLRTKSILTNDERMAAIREAGNEASRKFRAQPTFHRFFELSYEFSLDAGLVPSSLEGLLETINSWENCQATLAHLGNTVVATGDAEAIMEIFEGRGEVIRGRISKKRAGII